MKGILAVIAALTTMAASGCAIHTRDGSIVVDPKGRPAQGVGTGKFCPPGQAKKGNC